MKDFRKLYRVKQFNKRSTKPTFTVERQHWFGWLRMKKYSGDWYPGQGLDKVVFNSLIGARQYKEKQIESREKQYNNEIISSEIIKDE